MKRFLLPFIASNLILVGPLLATTSFTTPYYSQDEYQNAHVMFNKILTDLDRAQSNDHPKIIGDGARFDIARTEIGKLENQWDQACFDSGEFDHTYSALNMVLADNRLTGHDRDVLSADESRLIDFRNEYY